MNEGAVKFSTHYVVFIRGFGFIWDGERPKYVYTRDCGSQN